METPFRTSVSATSCGVDTTTAPGGQRKSPHETMRHAADTLAALDIPHETRVVSAHRTPQRLYDYATTAADRGLKVLVAGAGGAAHLPGMVAAMTALPVIGVPVKGSSLDGVDSLHSIVQMPVRLPLLVLVLAHARG